MILSGLSPYVRHARTHESRGVTPAYVDPEYVFTYILYGEGTFLLEDGRHRVKAGDCILMPPYMLHIINTDGGRPMGQQVLHFDLFERPERRGPMACDSRMTFARFKTGLANPECGLCDAPRTSSPEPGAGREIGRFITELKREFDGGDALDGLAVKARMLDILRFHLRAAAAGGRSAAESAIHRPRVWRNLERAITFIHEQHAQPVGLAAMAKAAGLSPNYFCRLFQDYTGCPPHRYLNAVRVKAARRLIDDGRLNFTQIAAACGFGSIHRFSKVFRRSEGLPPSGYKAGPDHEEAVNGKGTSTRT